MKSSILVVKLGAIGDVVLSLPMLHGLRARYPEAHITLLIGQSAAPLLQHDSAIDDLWIIDENDFWKKRLGKLLLLFMAVRRRRFSQVYLLHWSALFHLFFWLTGVPERIGFSREGRAFCLTRQIPYTEGDPAHHDADLYLRLALDAPAVPGVPTLTLTPEERASGNAFWAMSGGKRRVVLAPGGGHNAKLIMPLKRWPAYHFAALARKFEANGAHVLLVGSAQERALLDGLGLPAERNLAGTIDLRQTASLISAAQLFVGNDSGLTHIAGAVGTRSIALFGPTSPYGKEARGAAQHILYRKESCSPCYRFGYAPPCPYGLKCLTQITVEDVWAAREF